ELFVVLPLPGRPSAVTKDLALRLSRERFMRRSISRRIYANQSRQESHHERKCVRGIRRKDRKTTAGILLLDFPQHASEPAPGIHHGASALAAITGADAHCV